MLLLYATLTIPHLATLGWRALAACFRAVRRTVR
jgi:hypothetical protein